MDWVYCSTNTMRAVGYDIIRSVRIAFPNKDPYIASSVMALYYYLTTIQCLKVASCYIIFAFRITKVAISFISGKQHTCKVVSILRYLYTCLVNPLTVIPLSCCLCVNYLMETLRSIYVLDAWLCFNATSFSGPWKPCRWAVSYSLKEGSKWAETGSEYWAIQKLVNSVVLSINRKKTD